MGASSSVYRHCNHGTWATCWWLSGQPLFHTDSSFVLSRSITYEGFCWTISTKHGLVKCGLRMSPRWFAWHQISRGTMPPEDAVDGSTRQTHATSNSILPSRASASASCLMQIGVGWRLIRTISETWERNMQLLIRTSNNAKADLENDHLTCGFGLRRSHLALKWKSGQGKVGFRWGAVTGTFHINFSPLEAQKCDTYWFYWLKWDCSKLFLQKV